jgi:hypothetical protein
MVLEIALWESILWVYKYRVEQGSEEQMRVEESKLVVYNVV